MISDSIHLEFKLTSDLGSVFVFCKCNQVEISKQLYFWRNIFILFIMKKMEIFKHIVHNQYNHKEISILGQLLEPKN